MKYVEDRGTLRDCQQMYKKSGTMQKNGTYFWMVFFPSIMPVFFTVLQGLRFPKPRLQNVHWNLHV